jgi:hypothetical protein
MVFRKIIVDKAKRKGLKWHLLESLRVFKIVKGFFIGVKLKTTF